MLPKNPILKNTQHDSFSFARNLHTPIWVYDTDFQRIVYANKAACHVWGAASETDLMERDLSKDMSLTVTSRLRQYQIDFIDHNAKFRETWTIYPNGSPVTLNVVYSGFIMRDGRMAMLCEALGEPEQTTETLRSTEALLHTDVLIALYSEKGNLLYQNPAARRVFSSTYKNLDGSFIDEIDYADLREGLQKYGKSQKLAKLRTAKDESWFDISIKKCKDSVSGQPAFLITAFDVSELKTTRDRAQYLFKRDKLTGCYNRYYIQNHISEIEATMEQSNVFAILYFDIDMFKSINDTYGHEVGDVILTVFADRIRESIRDADVLVRMGGDEFVALISNMNSHNCLNNLLDQVQVNLKQPIDCGHLKLTVTSSIGVSMIDESQSNLATSLKNADLALYHAKRNGRDRYVVYNDLIGADAEERAWLEIELVKALKLKSFEVHYQPRINLTSNSVVALEALIRWFHPERGYISPDKFIPVLEEMDLISEVGTFVLERASQHLELWHSKGFEINISVNVSPRQLQKENFIVDAKTISDSLKIPTSRLELEITETTLVGENEEVYRRIQEIRALGFKIALDDFGTGYSNLAHISRFPIQCIKIDKTFIGQLPSTGPLISLIFALAKQINASVVAEGVETEKQLAWLEHNKCDEVQGFYFSRAIPAEEVIAACRNIERKLGNLICSS